MPEAAPAAPPAPVPSATTQRAPPAPPPAAVEAPKAAETPKAPEEKIEYIARLRQQEEAAAKERRAHLAERAKWQKAQAEARTYAEKLAVLEKREAMAKLNPAEFLQGLYGEQWYNTMVETRLNGVPPANLIAGEVQKLRDEFKASLEAQQKAQADAQQQQASRAAESARRAILEATTKAVEVGKYPALKERFGDSTAQVVAKYIEDEFNRTVQVDADGNVIRQGVVLGETEALKMLEKREREYSKRVAALAAEEEAQLTSEAKETTVAKKSQKPSVVPAVSELSVSQQQLSDGAVRRRTGLTNDITGTTKPPRPTLLSQAEREKRAIEAFMAARSRSR